MAGKHQKTIRAIFTDPVRANIPWADIEALLTSLGAERDERVRFVLNGIRAVFHRPHPRKEAGKGMVKSVRRFLEEEALDHDAVQRVHGTGGI